MIETYILAMVSVALVVLIASLAYGWYSAVQEADDLRRRASANWQARATYYAALRQIAYHPTAKRNNGSALKKIAREAVDAVQG